MKFLFEFLPPLTGIYFSIAPLRSKWIVIVAKCSEEFKFLGFLLYFLSRFEENLKNLKKAVFFNSIFCIFWRLMIFGWKVEDQTMTFSFLMKFAYLDPYLDPVGARLGK